MGTYSCAGVTVLKQWNAGNTLVLLGKAFDVGYLSE